MAYIRYIDKTFTKAHQGIIEQANAICEEYQQQGLTLTLRQVYYQFVARDLLPNKQSEYKRLGSILADARMAGEMDWDFLIDRTRNVVRPTTWDSPSNLIEQAAKQYATDLWAPQHERVEVWIEKDAGIGVIEPTCTANQVPYFSCRGYTSVSEIWAGAQRIRRYLEDGARVTILHIGDHDPSGLDMSRDIEQRLRTFVTRDWLETWGRQQGLRGQITRGQIKSSMRTVMRAAGGTIADHEDPWTVRRIALTVEQIERYSPPPNPAKQTDSRFQTYMEQTGLDESWELDALDPSVLQALINDEIGRLRDDGTWADSERAQDRDTATLDTLSQRWDMVAAGLNRSTP